MSVDDAVEYLVVTDAEASDDADLYPANGPSAGASSVSLPLWNAPIGGVAATHVTVLAFNMPVSGHDDRTSLWAGVLNLPSGDVVVADWSMTPQVTANLPPGSYATTIHQDAAGHLGVDFRPRQ